ncbi:MAG: GMC family oxidoreductase N-terminal domain-containing protein [Zoogloeaceae bacterium]|jgi:5-(hydroxymethyl)furfural/furfural oxidase|nr:GMC family oxidoreductase N-terminal domain-containing protein [Zoogloeaceae bacterium]
MTDTIFDYLIIGGGTAGSVLANRLTADASKRVLLVEAGIDTTEGATPDAILDGAKPHLPRLSADRFFWTGLNIFRAAEYPGIARQPQFYEQGKILGGGSSINVMVSNRGLPSDYDEWEKLGAAGWGWKDVLPYFRRLESDPEFGNRPEFADLHGLDGPLPIRRVAPGDWSRFTVTVAKVLESQGLPNIEDQNGRFGDGYFPPTFTIRNGERVSAARAYLDGKTRLRPNLLIWTETRALGLIVSGRRIEGVRLRRDGATVDIRARETILAAGALQTPGFLLRAGIGPAADLRALGIPVLADRPGVGKNLWDHSSLSLAARLTPNAEQDAKSAHTTMHQLGIRWSSGIDPAQPSDIFLNIGADPGSGFARAVFWINKPSSNGFLTLRDTDPETPPYVDFRLLSDTRDIGRLKAALAFVQRIFAHPALAAYGLRLALSRFAELTDGPFLADALRDEAAFERYLRENVGGVWHASGTAKIGRADDPLAVADPAGRVYGVEGLRVADASVFPSVPAANTNVPVLMVAEKLSDAILAGAGQ